MTSELLPTVSRLNRLRVHGIQANSAKVGDDKRILARFNDGKQDCVSMSEKDFLEIVHLNNCAQAAIKELQPKFERLVNNIEAERQMAIRVFAEKVKKAHLETFARHDYPRLTAFCKDIIEDVDDLASK